VGEATRGRSRGHSGDGEGFGMKFQKLVKTDHFAPHHEPDKAEHFATPTLKFVK
jgi:hypothetical protein